MVTPIVNGLTEVHHYATYSPPRPIYGLCRVGQPLRPTLRCDLLSGIYGTCINKFEILNFDESDHLPVACFVQRGDSKADNSSPPLNTGSCEPYMRVYWAEECVY